MSELTEVSKQRVNEMVDVRVVHLLLRAKLIPVPDHDEERVLACLRRTQGVQDVVPEVRGDFLEAYP